MHRKIYNSLLVVYLDTCLGCNLMILATLWIITNCTWSLISIIRLARPLTWWLLLLFLCFLEVLLIVCHNLNNLITKVICIVYLVGSILWTSIPCHICILRIFGIRLWINYRAIMVLQLGLIRMMIFVILMPISTQAIVLEMTHHIIPRQACGTQFLKAL